MPKLKGARFTTAAIERYRRQESSVEEAMIEAFLAGVSSRRIEGVFEVLWGSSVSAATISNLNDKAFDLCQDFGHGIERNHAAIGIASGLGSGRSKKASLGSVRSKKSAMASAGTL